MLTKKLIILGAGNTLLDVIEIAKFQGIENIIHAFENKIIKRKC